MPSKPKPSTSKSSPSKTRPPRVARTLSALHGEIAELRSRKASLALIPTMGALHDGHLSLVRLAKQRAKKVVVSIFVNPAQFAPHEDLSSYPRTWKEDVAKLTAEGVDLIWNPAASIMYPDGFVTRLAPEGPAAAGLEDRIRPHFFGGVATVVCKLFTQTRPDIAIFGEKDYQQLKVVTQMSRDLDLRVKVVGAAVVRERDGLAMSSRNVYLSAAHRAAAPVLFKTLKACAARLRAGDALAAVIRDGSNDVTDAGFAVDYLEARHAETLAPVSSRDDGPLRLLIAAKIGSTRLIDNVKV